ncbi:MAG: flavin reductase family protein [Eubacteriales bacterium]|nr:flavin reductase family protein [Eubacteriales bacterium]
MSYQKVDIKTYALKPFEAIGEKWTLITAEKDGVINTMTASWAGIGVLWSKNVVTVYIRPQRYTREFVEANGYFTLTLFDGYQKELAVLGSKSGRDGDKIKEVGFHAETVGGQPTFAEGTTAIVCKKLYRGRFAPEEFIETGIVSSCYPAKDFHYFYVGEVVGIYENR